MIVRKEQTLRSNKCVNLCGIHRNDDGQETEEDDDDVILTRAEPQQVTVGANACNNLTRSIDGSS